MCTLLPIGWINLSINFEFIETFFIHSRLSPYRKKFLWIRTSLCILYWDCRSVIAFGLKSLRPTVDLKNRDFPVKANSTGKCIIFLNKRRKKKTLNIATNSSSKGKIKMWWPNYICCPYLVTCKMPFERRYN